MSSAAVDEEPQIDERHDTEHQNDELDRGDPPRAAKLEELAQRDPERERDDDREDQQRTERGAEHDGRVDGAGGRAGPEILHRPNRRSRPAYDRSASSRCSTAKSGHSTSVAHISAYATSQSRKFDTRSSPPVRISRSGSGCSGA